MEFHSWIISCDCIVILGICKGLVPGAPMGIKIHGRSSPLYCNNKVQSASYINRFHIHRQRADCSPLDLGHLSYISEKIMTCF